tara:strand:- start:58 stop:435 length:378 start_codon:yes stop_codon:yes gene_type:complete
MKCWIAILFLISISISQEKGYIDSSKVRNPRLAWKLSAVPGLGQLYNGKYIKAIGFVAAEYTAVNLFNEYKKTSLIGLRNTYAWWIIGLYVWNILDAYVDAQLSTFPVKRLKSRSDVDSLSVPLE